MRLSLVLAFVAIAGAGCVDAADDPGTAAQGLGGNPDPTSCPKLLCGNTPLLGAYPFWELDGSGTAYSANQLRISKVTYLGVKQRTKVEGFNWGRQPILGGAWQPINGAVVHVVSSNGTESFELTINPAPNLAFYENGDDGTVIPTYWVTYVAIHDGVRDEPVDLCGPDGGSSLPRPAIVFQGDRYSATTGALMTTGEVTKPWFNITCKDDALWKLAVMRHVEAASVGAFSTTPAQRNTLLRSIRADYCGDGTPHTELGTAVDWTNLGGWLTTAGGLQSEAVWGPDGAICVDRTRIPNTIISCAAPRPNPQPCTATALAVWMSPANVRTRIP